jgi:hypothetical protein
MPKNHSKTAFLSAALVALLLLSADPMIGANDDAVDYGPMASRLASNGKMLGWIKDLYKIGAEGEYGYRMPGTPVDHAAANYVLQRFQEFGLQDTTLESLPIVAYMPDEWSLTIRVGDSEEVIPASFFRYTPMTSSEGVTAPMVYVGAGSEAEFQAQDVEGKIVLVDMLAPGIPAAVFDPITLFRYDPDDTIPGDMATENWPIINWDSFDRASEHGAVGFVGILTNTAADNNQHWHHQEVKPVTGLSLSPTDGDYLRGLLTAGQSVEATVVLSGYYGPGQSFNVYGFLPGQNTDEIIIAHSHHDGWATNEATGTSVVMALAKYFAQFPPESRERTLMFVAYGSHFAIRDQSNSLVSQLMQDGKVVWANVIEMIGKQVKIIDGEYTETGLIALAGFGMNRFAQVPIVAEAITKYDLDRSVIIPIFHGEGGVYAGAGIPTIERIAENAPQFSNDDTPNMVMVDALRPTTAAFVDIIKAIDGVPTDQLLGP